MDELRENLKKMLLAGVGAAATVVEKSMDVIDDLTKKGAEAVDDLARKGGETVEKGKAAGDDLKTALGKKYEEFMSKAPKTAEELEKWVATLSDDAKKTLSDILNACKDDEECEGEKADEEKAGDDIQFEVVSDEKAPDKTEEE